MEINGVEIDWLGQEVLLVLEEAEDGISNTTEVRESVGLHGDQAGRRVKHRFDRLEEAGLVITEQPEPKDNVWPPKQVMLTDDGRRVLESDDYPIDGDNSDETVRETVDRLETVVTRLERENALLKRMLFEGDDLPDIIELRKWQVGMANYLEKEIQIDVEDYIEDEFGTGTAREEANELDKDADDLR